MRRVYLKKKKFRMTHLRIHLIYLVLIGFLAYQYWTKTEALHHATESIEQLDRLLERNNQTASQPINGTND